MIDTELLTRIAEALEAKWEGHEYGWTRKDLVSCVVWTTVCDTAMILNGTVPLEAFQDGTPFTQKTMAEMVDSCLHM